MNRDQLRASVRRLIFATPTLSRAVMSGNFRSAFRGRGMDFDGLREYDPNDDAMRMDWNATARLAKPYIKTWRDDRSLAVYLIVDESASMDFGRIRSKRETCALAASLLAYACVQNGASAGALFFGGHKHEHRKPLSGDRAAFSLVERIASGSAGMGGSNLAAALDQAMLHLKRRSLVVVLSDFLSTAWERPLATLARKHDTALIHVHDELDDSPPAVSFCLRATDSESHRPYLVLPRSGQYRDARTSEASARKLALLSAAAAARVPVLQLDGSSEPARAMTAFFGQRRPL